LGFLSGRAEHGLLMYFRAKGTGWFQDGVLAGRLGVGLSAMIAETRLGSTHNKATPEQILRTVCLPASVNASRTLNEGVLYLKTHDNCLRSCSLSRCRSPFHSSSVPSIFLLDNNSVARPVATRHSCFVVALPTMTLFRPLTL
jgi:hypothetical protein